MLELSKYHDDPVEKRSRGCNHIGDLGMWRFQNGNGDLETMVGLAMDF